VPGEASRRIPSAHHGGKTPDTMESVEMRRRRPQIVPTTRRRSEDVLRHFTLD
jgi:hypothetical protein